MGGVILNKENLKGVLDILKERYGNIKLAELSDKIWNDDDFRNVTLYQKLLSGKRAKLVLKSEGVSGLFKWGKKL